MWIRLLQNFRSPGTAWWDLNDHYLSDIGKTRAEAESEALRRSWSGRIIVGPEEPGSRSYLFERKRR
jgi:hypothetical protein